MWARSKSWALKDISGCWPAFKQLEYDNSNSERVFLWLF